ncbi:MAG: Ig-like domain-containing protein [Cyclobacteriaceae bacterium]
MKKTMMYLFMGMSVGTLFLVESCSKSSDALPTIGGYSSSDAVAPDNLVSYFPFEGNANDSKGTATATEVNVTYATKGVKGKAYQGAAGAYATLAPSTAFSSLPSYTVSMWYKVTAQPTSGTGPQGLFFLSGTASNSGTDYEPSNGTELIFEIDLPSESQVGTDSLKIHHGFTNLNTNRLSGAWNGFTMEAYDTTDYKNWVHLVATYDGGSSTYIIYQDGVPILNSSAWGKKTSYVLYQGNSGDAGTTGQGDLSWTPDPPKAITIGTWPAGVYGVSPSLGSNGCFRGQLDEIRIYNKALSPTDIGALYLLGVAGRSVRYFIFQVVRFDLRTTFFLSFFFQTFMSRLINLLFFLLIYLVSACKNDSASPKPPVFYVKNFNLDGLPQNSNYTNVSVTPQIVVLFSAPVDRSSTTGQIAMAGSSTVPLTITFSNNDSTITVSPVNPLQAWKNYQFVITNKLLSVSKNNLSSSISLTITTGVDPTPKFPTISDSALLDSVQFKTFKYFYDFGHPNSGMARERDSSGDIVTTGGSGFGLMAMIVGIERGYISRADGVARFVKIVSFLETANRFHGAWSHWINGNTGVVVPFGTNDDGADIVETSYMIHGLLTVRQYLTASDTAGNNLIKRITKLYDAVDWNWFRRAHPKM